MLDVHVSVTSEFHAKTANLPKFCAHVRRIVEELFEVGLPSVSVKMEFYAPGCEEGRPHVAVSVTVNEDHWAPKHDKLLQALADRIKPVADVAIGGDAGKVKAMIDLGIRKAAFSAK